MRVSTQLKSVEEREKVFEQISKSYPNSRTDYYVTAIGNDQYWESSGTAIKFRSIDHGDISHKKKIDRLHSELEDDTVKITQVVSEIEASLARAREQVPILEEELSRLQKERTEFMGVSNFLKRISRNPKLQADFKHLKERMNSCQEKLLHYKSILDDEAKRLELEMEGYASRKELIEQSLIRSETLYSVELERIQILYKQKKKLESEYKQLTNDLNSEDSESLWVAPSGSESKFSIVRNKIRDEIAKNERVKLFMEQREIVHNQDIRKIKMRALKLEIRQLSEQISKLEDEHSRSGRIKQVYYLQKGFGKDDDLVCFSRVFRGDKVDIESEMSHNPRITVDQSETLKPLYTVTVLLTLLVLVLIVTDLIGIDFDIINYHTFYLLAIVLMNFRNLDKIQNKDHIFDGLYYFTDTSEIVIQYYDEKNELTSIPVVCYHLHLLYSRKQNIWGFIQSTEADIIAQVDLKSLNMNVSLQKEISRLNMEIVALKSEVTETTKMNQDLVNRSEGIKENAKADLLRSQNYKAEVKPTFWESTGADIVKYAGSGAIIYMILSTMQQIMPDSITINETATSTGGFGFPFLIGFILGISIPLGMSRIARSR